MAISIAVLDIWKWSISVAINHKLRLSKKKVNGMYGNNMKRVILHIDFNSYFATVEQQANPRLRGKPIAVTGGDRLVRTVVGAASIEAKKLGIKTGMNLQEALRIYPDLVLVKGDSDKYLSCTKKFLNILKDYTPLVEVFSIDEAFVQLGSRVQGLGFSFCHSEPKAKNLSTRLSHINVSETSSEILHYVQDDKYDYAISVAQQIKKRVSQEIGEWVTCSIGISYNKRMAKLAGSMQKPNGLVVIADEEAAQFVLDRTPLDEICGIGFRIKKRLNNMGIFNFTDLRKVDLKNLLAAFKSYGKVLYDMCRGVDQTPLIPFYLKEEVKSIGHRHTTSKDISDPVEIKQLLLKLSELVARKLRAKKLVGKTITVWFRYAFNLEYYRLSGQRFSGDSMQTTIKFTDDGWDIFSAGWKLFLKLWIEGEPIRMVGISASNLTSKLPNNLNFLDDEKRKEKIINTLDKVNDKYGEFTIFRGILLNSRKVMRKPNAFLADYRFKIG